MVSLRLLPAQRLQQATLLYSGGCRFCRWAARLIVALDIKKELRVIPCRSTFAVAHLPHEYPWAHWWIHTSNGVVRGDDGGIITLLKSLWLTRWLGHIAERLNLCPFFNRFDRWVKEHRSVLSGLVKDNYAPLELRGWWTPGDHIEAVIKELYELARTA